jgi:hypothetical protein
MIYTVYLGDPSDIISMVFSILFVLGVLGYVFYKRYFEDTFHIAFLFPSKVKSMKCVVEQKTLEDIDLGVRYDRYSSRHVVGAFSNKRIKNRQKVKQKVRTILFQGDYPVELVVPKNVYDMLTLRSHGTLYYYKSYFKKFVFDEIDQKKGASN